ncbi:hypothetical protein V2J09_010462 [Rumex salicifolius]
MEELGLDAPSAKLSIIAMKGPPFTRTTEFATPIAASLGCPILCFEHFLYELEPSLLSQHREYKAFRVICTMAHYHLSRGVSKIVVIDSPLSSIWHLTQLAKVASSLPPMPARIVIIECKPTNMYSWELKFEEHLIRHPGLACEWYKPKCWEDVEKAVEAKGADYDERSVQGHELVSKLVVDPLSDLPVNKVTANIYHLHINPQTTPDLYMIGREEGVGPDVVYHQWQQRPLHVNDSSLHCSNYGHNIQASRPKFRG